MANTFITIQTVTAGSAVASIDFNSIPQTYTDLKLVASTRMTATASDTWYDFTIRLNNSTTGDSGKFMYGNGSTVASASDASDIVVRTSSSNATASSFGNAEVYIPNYTSANNKYVSIDNVSESNGTQAFAGFTAGLWANTSAVTSIILVPLSGNFAQYTKITLYGIKSS
jgi:hypothetical protein